MLHLAARALGRSLTLLALGCAAPGAELRPTAAPAHAVTPVAAAAPAAPQPTQAPAPWWNPPEHGGFDAARLSRALPRINVDGNRFVDEQGATVVFQGVNIADPDHLVRNGHWNRELFQAIAGWGA